MDVCVVMASGAGEWLRVFARVLRRQVRQSPFVSSTTGETMEVRLSEPMAWELDGNTRKPSDHLSVHVGPLAILVCVPRVQR